MLKDKVAYAAKREAEAFRKTPAWLNKKPMFFDHGLRLSEDDKKRATELFELCGFSKRKENRISFEILIANLIRFNGKWPVVISFDVNEWMHTRYTRAGGTTIALTKKLHEQKFINIRKGYNMEHEARKTRIRPTEKLLDHFPKIHNAVIYEPVELVLLRDENKKLKEYKDTAKTKRIRSILRRANKVNQKADIRCSKDKLSGSLVAIFTRKFTLYGRLHTRGYRHYQGFDEDKRAGITINGDPVVELDFSGLHPHLLYAKEGIQFSGDPYAIVNDNPVARPFLKQILLCMLNAKDETAAERAANFWLFQNHKEREDLKKIGIENAGPLIDAFMEAHRRIAHHLFSGTETGLRIMNLDAKIALDIVNHFVKQNIPILCVHDSFIVQSQFKDELKQTMEGIYEKHTGGFTCPIK